MVRKRLTEEEAQIVRAARQEAAAAMTAALPRCTGDSRRRSAQPVIEDAYLALGLYLSLLRRSSR